MAANPKSIQNEVTRAQCAVPSTTSVAATETRKIKSAVPAVPVGNMENSLCTDEGYPRPDGRAISKGGLADYPFVGCKSNCAKVMLGLDHR